MQFHAGGRPIPSELSIKEADAQGQNVFGVKIIAGAIGIVGAGIALLGLLAERGMVALIVGLVILVLAFPLWISATTSMKLQGCG